MGFQVRGGGTLEIVQDVGCGVQGMGRKFSITGATAVVHGVGCRVWGMGHGAWDVLPPGSTRITTPMHTHPLPAYPGSPSW